MAVPAVQRRRDPGVSGARRARDKAAETLERLKDDYARAVQQSKASCSIACGAARLIRARNMSTPEDHEWSRSAPGTEAWKQDYAKWEGLGKDVTQALERYEGSAAEQAVARVDGRSAPRRRQRPRA